MGAETLTLMPSILTYVIKYIYNIMIMSYVLTVILWLNIIEGGEVNL